MKNILPRRVYILLRTFVRWLRVMRLRYFGDVGYISRHMHHIVIWMFHFKSIIARRAVVKNLDISPQAQNITDSLISKGYYFTSLEKLGASTEVLEYCRELSGPVEKFDLSEVKKMRSGKSKSYWLDLYDENNSHSNPLLDFITMPVLVQAAVKYFNEVPILGYISLLFTPPWAAKLRIGSQEWHKDNECLKQMKVFLLGYPVSSDVGPSKLLSRANSPVSGYRNFPGYFSDDQLKEFSLPVEDIIEFTGEAGSVLLIDTSALFHCGSRTMEKPRLQAIAGYHPLMSNLPYRVFKKIHLPESAYARTNENIMSDLKESIL